MPKLLCGDTGTSHMSKEVSPGHCGEVLRHGRCVQAAMRQHGDMVPRPHIVLRYSRGAKRHDCSSTSWHPDTAQWRIDAPTPRGRHWDVCK